jgi:pentatricopeptide repeat protein
MSKTARRAAKRALQASAKGVGKPDAGRKPPQKASAPAGLKEAVEQSFVRNNWQQALAALERMRESGLVPTTTLLNKVLTVCGRHKQWQLALSLLQQMRGLEPGPGAGVPPSAVSYSIVIKAAGLAGQVSSALEVLQSMREDGKVVLDAVAYNAAITACRCEPQQHLPDALSFFQEARDKGHADVALYNALLGVYKAGGLWEPASQLLGDMLAGAKGAPQPDAMSFTSAIAACGAAQQPDAALQLLSRMAPRQVQACNAAVTACERSGRWQDALRLLADMERNGPQPDEITVRAAVFACCGASQLEAAMALFRRVQAGAFPGVRTNALTTNLLVRACDVAGHASDATRLLAGVLQVGEHATLAAAESSDTAVIRHADWAPPPLADGPAAAQETPAVPPFSGRIRVVHHEPGHQRRPRNVYDLRIFATEPGAVTFTDDAAVAPHVTATDVPAVPGAFVLRGVLTRQECSQLVAVSEAMGYSKDEPERKSASAQAAPAQDGIDNCCWLADDSLQGHIWARVKAALPPSLFGCAIAGLNARWRLFRYAPGAVYRPHVDGSWPGSGLGPDGQYIYDAFKDSPRRSKLTFLMYLNDDIQGGHTVLYTPSTAVVGGLDARGVAPSAGCVLCFPHGDTPGSLVHEGSAVQEGVKYVIRTEVLFHSPQ